MKTMLISKIAAVILCIIMQAAGILSADKPESKPIGLCGTPETPFTLPHSDENGIKNNLSCIPDTGSEHTNANPVCIQGGNEQ